MIPGRWEHGSDQHWITPDASVAQEYPWRDRGVLYGSGRFALDAILSVAGVRRLWVPSFYCPDALAALQHARPTILVYSDSPVALRDDHSDLPVEHGDAVLVQNIYGLRAEPPRMPRGALLIEDHTHDPTSRWAYESGAAYCFTSLRKLLPVPDGGVVWSPTGAVLPQEPALDEQHVRAALDRLTGSMLKAAYLAGAAVSKDVYRSHQVAGEHALARGPISTALPLTRAALPGIPVAAWRTVRAQNFAAFAAALGDPRGCALMRPRAGAVAFIATLRFDSPDRREHVRRELIAERIYPAVLWPLADASYAIPAAEVALSREILSLHCDHRYSPVDLERVARVVTRALA